MKNSLTLFVLLCSLFAQYYDGEMMTTGGYTRAVRVCKIIARQTDTKFELIWNEAIDASTDGE